VMFSNRIDSCTMHLLGNTGFCPFVEFVLPFVAYRPISRVCTGTR